MLRASERKMPPPRHRPRTPREQLMDSIKQGRRLRPSFSPLKKRAVTNPLRLLLPALHLVDIGGGEVCTNPGRVNSGDDFQRRFSLTFSQNRLPSSVN
uniref:WH2 domain-containing protein n=1 Tax=Timema cristinae TaxID=61476 RepID=A0A7R9CGT6_TIMCR|nr:unnamed protein product [Timema cristinae]